MPEITEEDWQNLVKDVGSIKDKVESFKVPDLSKFITKSNVEQCIGPHCEKIESKVAEQIKEISGMKKKLTHLDDVVHRIAKPEPKSEPHGHENWNEAVKCPDCYPEIEKAVKPKIEASLPKPQPIELSDEVKRKVERAFKKSGVPYCTRCCTPWEDESKDCCVNCGEPK